MRKGGLKKDVRVFQERRRKDRVEAELWSQ
jgi:hypothetical protein